MGESGDLASTCDDSRDAAGGDVRAIPARPGLVQIFPRPLDRPPLAWPASGHMTIGRHSRCTIRLNDERVSREHASLSASSSGLRLADLGSRHGTFVNGLRLANDALVALGSVIRCGNSLLLAVASCDAYSTPHRLTRDFLGTTADILGGPDLWRVWQRATHAGELQEPVLLLGESGTGKEVAARLIHAVRRERGPFVPLNLAAIQAGLFESELFGHVRGAFTGASRARMGAFREAEGGVLFLDEVGDLAPDLQVKILRAVEQRRVRPVGAEQDFPFNARIISATSRDLRAACDEGRFRIDLYHRLAGITIELPSLRDRPDDVLLLAQAMLRESAPELELSVEAAEALTLAEWPGNVRELQNALVHARMELRQAGGNTLRCEHFALGSAASERLALTLTPEAVRAAMARESGNASRAAKALGISRATLYNFCGRHGVALAAVRAEVSAGHEGRHAKSN